MPLPLPNLDDRTFADLTQELRSLIHQYDKQWTNHNPSDPGITLIELFAWHAELLMYRMNRLEQRSYLGFLELLGVQPEGAQAVLTFEVNLPFAALPPTFSLPRGTRVSARNARSLEEIVFETLVEVPYHADYWDGGRSLWVFKAPAMNTKLMEQELLGISNGAKRQAFKLKQCRLFLDRQQETYIGNPHVTVDGGLWAYKADLLDSLPTDEHVTADPLTGLLQFGDGVHGKIPPEGAVLRCTYRCVGDSKGNVTAGTITTLLDDPVGVVPASAVSVFNEYPAIGGVAGESLDDLLGRGLASIRDPYRAVSDRDFEALAKQAAPGKIARATAVPDRNFETVPPTNAEAHMSVIVFPTRSQLGLPDDRVVYVSSTKTFTLNRTTATMIAALGEITIARLKQEVGRFLDSRRLMTTIVHVIAPAWISVGLEIEVQSKPGVDRDILTETIGLATAQFLDPYEGWEDRNGWPYGRDLYRSELFQMLESLEGVDHVTALLMNGNATTSAIPIGEHRLIGLDGLTVTVT